MRRERGRSAYGWDVWRWDGKSLKASPIKGSEPFVLDDVIDATFQVSKAFARLCGQEFADKVTQLASDINWEANSTSNNLFIGFHWLIGIEGRPASHHFIN
jgi:hypothetical protein